VSQACVYQAVFSPHHAHLVVTASADGTVKIFDLRAPTYATGPGANSFTTPLSVAALTIPASTTEILSVDWNKYRPFILGSGSVDKMVKIWDARMVEPKVLGPPGGAGSAGEVAAPCEAVLQGHEYAVRKVQWSPHRPDVLASAGYDMTCRVYALFLILQARNTNLSCSQMEHERTARTAASIHPRQAY
jgi:peroxin-7